MLKKLAKLSQTVFCYPNQCLDMGRGKNSWNLTMLILHGPKKEHSQPFDFAGQ